MRIRFTDQELFLLHRPRLAATLRRLSALSRFTAETLSLSNEFHGSGFIEDALMAVEGENPHEEGFDRHRLGKQIDDARTRLSEVGHALEDVILSVEADRRARMHPDTSRTFISPTVRRWQISLVDDEENTVAAIRTDVDWGVIEATVARTRATPDSPSYYAIAATPDAHAPIEIIFPHDGTLPLSMSLIYEEAMRRAVTQ